MSSSTEMKDISEECHMRVLIEVVLFDVERLRSHDQTNTNAGFMWTWEDPSLMLVIRYYDHTLN